MAHAESDMDEPTMTFRRKHRRFHPSVMTVVVGLLLLVLPLAYFLGTTDNDGHGAATGPPRRSPSPTPAATAVISAVATAGATAVATAVATIIERPGPGQAVHDPIPAPAPTKAPAAPVHTTATHAPAPSSSPSPSRKCVVNLLGVCV